VDGRPSPAMTAEDQQPHTPPLPSPGLAFGSPEDRPGSEFAGPRRLSRTAKLPSQVARRPATSAGLWRREASSFTVRPLVLRQAQDGETWLPGRNGAERNGRGASPFPFGRGRPCGAWWTGGTAPRPAEDTPRLSAGSSDASRCTARVPGPARPGEPSQTMIQAARCLSGGRPA
jgi:hypothetical protein